MLSVMGETHAFALDCKAAISEYVQSWIHELLAMLQVLCGISARTLKVVLMASFTLLTMTSLVFLAFLGCLTVSVIGSFAIRMYVLSHVPVSQLLRLDFNLMPLETEFWRLQRLNSVVLSVSSSMEPTSRRTDDAVAMRENDDMETQLRSVLVQQEASFKMSVITRHAESMIATSTLVIPSLVHKDVFPPGGGVSMEGLFQMQEPMFNAPGVYDAKVQLVFLREDVGRDISLVLESSMLIAEDPLIPQAIGSLDVLLKTTTSFTIITGEKMTSWPMTIFYTFMRLVFYFPLWFYDRIESAIPHNVFPSVDREKEVAVVATVYSGFTPPVYLQPRLRAINFTLYQHVADGSKKVRVKQMYFYSGVQLTGLPYYFSDYSVQSFAMTTILLFILCCLVMTGGAVFLAGRRLFSRRRHSMHSVADAKMRGLDDSSDEEDAGKMGKGMLLGLVRRDDVPNTPSLSSNDHEKSQFSSFDIHETDWAVEKERKSK